MRQLPVPDPGTPDLRSPSRFVVWLMARQRASVLLGIVWGCAWMIAQALVPAAIGAAVDSLARHRTGAFTEDCLAVLGLGVLTAVTGVLRHRRVVANFLDAAYRIIQLITEHTTRLGNTLAKLLSTGEVVSVGTADVDAVGGAIDVSGRGSGAVASVIVVAVILLTRSLPLGLIVLIGGPVLTVAVGALLKPLHRRQQKYRDLQGQLATRAADIVAGLRVLRGIGGEPAFSTRYRSQSQDLRHTGVHVARTESFLAGAEILLPGLFVTAATWIAAHYALHRIITPGQLVTFYAYTSFLAVPLATITEAADKIVRGHVAAGRVIAILRLRPEVSDPAQPAPQPPPGASLADPASGLTVSAGELIGVAADDPAQAAELADRIGGYLGESGPRLGGVALADLPVSSVRSRMLVASNDAHIFAGRLDEQLGGAATRTPEATLAAITAASAGDVLDAVGLDGQLAARGRTLSGGQAQRVRLARALLADPDILILVEPTSAVDAHTEAAIAARLRTAREGRTTVVISNSPLLLDQADRVAFLRDGRIAALGSHRNLMAASVDYAAAVSRAGEP
ncbi:MAG TPA: ABC transporter ATP-binding protein [Streptosporangiaceae bacterium]|nr:ABC transporter ATP-binding protein [Streptosporangiaceae bacterium]